MKKESIEKVVIDMVTASYQYHSRLLKEQALGIIKLSDNDYDICLKIKKHIEIIVANLDERDRFIIENEVLYGKKGNWYLDYYSAPTYYRTRNRAYQKFYEELNKRY